MNREKTERLLNLVIALLATSRYLSREQVRRAVPGYSTSDEAFERAFERDKEELRAMGIPIETGTSNAAFDDEVGYRIRRDAYALPETAFAPDEMAVLALAARAWQEASLARAAQSALRKLEAYGVETADLSIAGIEPRVDAAEAAFKPLWAAVRDRAPVRFGYRRPGAELETRTVEPWGIVSWHGRWYLVGHDRARAATRVFRVSRVVGAVTRAGKPGDVVVPAGVDIRSEASAVAATARRGVARLRVRTGAAGFLRRQAGAVAHPDGEDWDVVQVPYGDAGLFADAVAGFGPAVIVLEPGEVREAVVRRLESVLVGAGAGREGGGGETGRVSAGARAAP